MKTLSLKPFEKLFKEYLTSLNWTLSEFIILKSNWALSSHKKISRLKIFIENYSPAWTVSQTPTKLDDILELLDCNKRKSRQKIQVHWAYHAITSIQADFPLKIAKHPRLGRINLCAYFAEQLWAATNLWASEARARDKRENHSRRWIEIISMKLLTQTHKNWRQQRSKRYRGKYLIKEIKIIS